MIAPRTAPIPAPMPAASPRSLLVSPTPVPAAAPMPAPTMAPAMALLTFFDDEHAETDRENTATPHANRKPVPLLTIFSPPNLPSCKIKLLRLTARHR